jgi:hypothetical protein
VGKMGFVNYWPQYRCYYDITAFCLANGSMIVCMYYGFDMFYSEKNNCDFVESTALLSSIMFVILFIGYFFCFMYLMIAFAVPCLWCMIRDQAENSRRAAGGVG